MAFVGLWLNECEHVSGHVTGLQRGRNRKGVWTFLNLIMNWFMTNVNDMVLYRRFKERSLNLSCLSKGWTKSDLIPHGGWWTSPGRKLFLCSSATKWKHFPLRKKQWRASGFTDLLLCSIVSEQNITSNSHTHRFSSVILGAGVEAMFHPL